MASTKPATSAQPRTKKRLTQNPARKLAYAAVEAALDKKAHDLLVMDLRGVSGVADYFLICTGDSDLQIKAIADSVLDRIKDEYSERPWHVEGYEHLQWVLLDYVDLVVHIFSPERRAFYGLERLWGDATTEHVPDDGSASDVKLLRAEDGGI
jgi:ribosome-associated protein